MHFSKITDILEYHNFSGASQSLNMCEIYALLAVILHCRYQKISALSSYQLNDYAIVKIEKKILYDAYFLL